VNLRQLEYFLAVVDEGSFRRGAQRVHVSPPSLSQQIRALERELGGELIERLSRGIRLTAAGKAFLPEARAAVLASQRAVRAARGALALDRAELEIATVTSLSVGILPASIQRLHEARPSVVVRLQEYTHRDDLVEAVRSGVGDIAIGPRPPVWEGPIESLGYEQFVVVLGPRDPLFGQPGPIELTMLADREWVLFPPWHGLAVLTTTACASAGFLPRDAVRTGQVEAAARLAAAGLGVTLVPDNIVPAHLAGHTRQLEPPIVRELVAYTRSEWSPPARAFLEALRSADWQRRPSPALEIT
jgi:DNA-binding transcriptional LysR family regulator